MRVDPEAVLAGRGGFPGADVIEVSVHATRLVREEVSAAPLTLAHLAELADRCADLGIDPATVVVWQHTNGDGETERVRVTGAGVRRPIEETALAPRTDADVAVDRQRNAQAWTEGYETGRQVTWTARAAGQGEDSIPEPHNPYALS